MKRKRQINRNAVMQNRAPGELPDAIMKKFAPLEKQVGIFTFFGFLLKSPETIVYESIHNTSSKIAFRCLIIMACCTAIYGLINGSMFGGICFANSAVKFFLIIFLSGLICLPSFYIFLTLTGINIPLGTAITLLWISLSITSILMLGFAPILWIFAQSTNAVPFMGILNIVFCSVSAYFGIRILHRSVNYLSNGSKGMLYVWLIMLVFVVLQMTTALRPIIGTPGQLVESEKKFFMQYWGDVFNSHNE